MRLSNSISRGLALPLALLISLTFCAAEPAGQEMPPTDLDGWIQKGERILRAASWDPAELLETAQSLANGSGHGVQGLKGSAALLLSAKLYAKAEKHAQCVTSCLQLLDTYPQTPAAVEACELAGTVMADRLGKTLEAAELFEKRALAFPQENEAERFLKGAFAFYEEAEAWDRAVDCGQRYLEYFADRPSAAYMQLQLVNIWLKQDAVGRAKRSLVKFIQDYRDDPYTVLAHQTLAEVYSSEGKSEKATEHRAQAWSCYQQHAEAGHKMAADVRHAAAQALFDLQVPRRTDFRRACEFVPNTVSEADPKPLANALIASYNQVMSTDAGFALQGLIAQAEVCEALGNFLLQQGYVRFANAKGPQERPPHNAAMVEYVRAIALYERAWDHARLQEETPELARLAEQAATRAVELRLGNGDLAFGWALQLQQRLPSSLGTPEGLEKRFEALNSTVYPVLTDGLTHYKDAQAMAVKTGLRRLAERSRSGLAVPLEPFAAELFALNRNACNAVSKAAFQVVSSVEMSEQAATAMSQFSELEAAHAQAMAFAPRTAERSREILLALRDAHASLESQTAWENHTLGFFQDYASSCRDVAARLEAAITRLEERKGGRMERLQRRLRSVSRELASQEYRELQEAYQLCEELAITSPASDRILARLVALNPKEYRDRAETRFGTRQKP